MIGTHDTSVFYHVIHTIHGLLLIRKTVTVPIRRGQGRNGVFRRWGSGHAPCSFRWKVTILEAPVVILSPAEIRALISNPKYVTDGSAWSPDGHLLTFRGRGLYLTPLL
jgi:hypothetical protein